MLSHLTKQAHFILVKSTTTTKQLVPIFMRDIFRLHGCSEEIVSYRDTKFTSEFWTAFVRGLGIQQNLTSAYHPQTNGQTEKTNGTMEDLLRPFCHDRQQLWEETLPMVEYAYNTSKHAATGFSPMQLV